MKVSRDGRTWRIGTAEDVAWLAGRPLGRSVVTPMPLAFEAYATPYVPRDETPVEAHKRAVVTRLAAHTEMSSTRLPLSHSPDSAA